MMTTNTLITKILPKDPMLKKIVVHSAIVLLIFIGFAILSISLQEQSPYVVLTILLFGFFTSGLVHNYAIKYFYDCFSINEFIKGIRFTLILSLAGFTVIAFFNQSSALSAYLLPFALCSIYFTLPHFVQKTLSVADQVPSLIPPSYRIQEIDSAKETMIFAVTDKYIKFIFEEDGHDLPKNGNLGYPIVPSKIVDLSLLKIFKAFLLRYNSKGRGNDPRIVYDLNHQWIFYVKRPMGLGKRFLNPMSTLSQSQVFLSKGEDKIKGVLTPLFKLEIFVQRKHINS